MSAKKQTSGDGGAAVSALKIARPSRWLVASTVIVLVTSGVAFAVWQQVRHHVLARGEYLVDPQSIVITPPPAWVHSDIRAEVIRDASFDGPLSLLDSELTVRLASAFSTHPWVAHVERVSKQFPSGIDVRLSYRRPVAMVEVQGGALPVDAEGVLLPTSDFSTEEAEAYPRIGAIHTPAPQTVGSRWADSCVLGGAQIATALLGEWKTLELALIEPAGRKPGRTGAEYVYTIFTRGGTRIDWGRVPSSDAVGELSAAEKVVQIRTYASKHGSLDAESGPQQLTFLPNGELALKVRRPIRNLPKTDE